METTQPIRPGVYDAALTEIIGAVAGTFAVSPAAIRSRSRRSEVQLPRLAIYAIAEAKQIPPRVIVTALGRHRSISRAYGRSSRSLMKTDVWFQKLVKAATDLCS